MEWGDRTSDILADIASAKEEIRKNTGQRRSMTEKVVLCPECKKHTFENSGVCMWCGEVLLA